MSRFAVVKRNDSVYGMLVDIYGPETFRHMSYGNFMGYVTSINAQSINWFDDKDEALSFFRELGGSEFLAVTMHDNYVFPLHVLDSCPIKDANIVFKAAFTTDDECEQYCKEHCAEESFIELEDERDFYPEEDDYDGQGAY